MNSRSERRSALPALRVLVVDDFPPLRAIAARMLRQLGHTVSDAGDGAAAIEALQAEMFDVVLLDLSMPGIGGLEVVRWMRHHRDQHSDPHVAVMSAWASDDRHELTELGVQSVLAKPFRQYQVEDILRNVAESKAIQAD